MKPPLLHSVARPLILTSLALALSSCTPPRKVEDPHRVLLDPQASTARRLRAGELAHAIDPQSPEHLKALQQLIWSPQQPMELRSWAVREWTAVDAAGFQKELRANLPRVQHWPTLELLLEHIRQQNWRELTPALIRQYAREVRNMPDAQRPERATLEALNPGLSIEGMVCDLITDDSPRANLIERVAAWELLCRLMSREQREAWLVKLPATSPVVLDLQTCLRELRTLPVNREGVLWLAFLRDPSQSPRWDELKQKVSALSPEQARGLELRHLSVLLSLTDDQLTEPRAALRDWLTARLTHAQVHPSPAEFDAAAAALPESWSVLEPRMSWADLQTLRVLLQALEQKEIRAALFAQADADRADTTTEHAGVLDVRDEAGASGFVVEACEPMLREHDRKFLAGPDMIMRLYTALAHYHFHAQEHKNAAFAGPGRGDLEFARRLNLTCLVLTFIDASTLNVDCYDPAGHIVDLGVIRR